MKTLCSQSSETVNRVSGAGIFTDEEEEEEEEEELERLRATLVGKERVPVFFFETFFDLELSSETVLICDACEVNVVEGRGLSAVITEDEVRTTVKALLIFCTPR
jgi:hypothetical protein